MGKSFKMFSFFLKENINCYFYGYYFQRNKVSVNKETMCTYS